MSSSSKKKDVEEQDEAKLYPYPKSVWFIISTEFCERFSFYGMKTVLALFFKQVLNFDQNVSTLLYHAFTAICYFTPVLGAIIADSFVGKFRTIFYISIIYALGQIILTIGAIGDTENGNEGIDGLPAEAMAYIGLLLIAIGTGGIKPCVASFGGEQFKLPEQASYMAGFFSLFYASINGGSLISTILTPILRQETSCFGKDSCYPLAFGVPAALMIVAILFFLAGRLLNFYVLITPTENIIVKTSKCIWHSFQEKRRLGGKVKKDSFLDYGEKEYGKSFVDDVKALGSIVYMFLPFPIFWALFDQQGSRWTFQATRMNGETFGFVILPDMMQVSNPILILGFIPIFDYAVYPLLGKFKLFTTPLQRIVGGGVLAMLSFVVSGILEISLEQTYPNLPTEGNMHFTVYNGLENCSLGNVSMYQRDPNNKIINEIWLDFSNANTKYQEINDVPQGQWYFGPVNAEAPCAFKTEGEYAFQKASPPPKVKEDEYEDNAQHILISKDLRGNQPFVRESDYRERLEKSDTGLPIVKLFWNIDVDFTTSNATITMEPLDGGKSAVIVTDEPIGDAPFEVLKEVGKYRVKIEHGGLEILTEELKDVELKLGGNYQILVQFTSGVNPDDQIGVRSTVTHQITSENSIHIFWLLPQFVIMTAGEIMFSIQSLQFSFTQAPESMKAVMMAIRMLTNAIGNVIDVVVVAALKDVFDSQVYFFFLFAGIMLLDMILLGWMAKSYVYKDYTTRKREDTKEKEGVKNENYIADDDL